MRLEGLPELHAVVLRDGREVFGRFGLVLAGGYALRAHEVTSRPSQDLDLATGSAVPLPGIAGEVAAHYRQAGYAVEMIEAGPRSARMILTRPGGGRLDLDLLKEALGPGTVMVTGPGTGAVAVLGLDDAVGLKVRGLHDRSYPRDVIDLHALGDRYTFRELEQLARHHEPDLDPHEILDHLGAVPVFTDDAFAAYGLAADTITDLRAWAARWYDDLAARLTDEDTDDGW